MLIRCPFCFKEYDSDYGKCISCDTPSNAFNGNNQLPISSVIHEYYFVGKVNRVSSDFIEYRAFDLRNNCTVFLKEYFPSEIVKRGEDNATVVPLENKENDFETALKNFKEEINLEMSFRGHRNILTSYESFDENGTSYVISEFVDGELYSEKLKRHEFYRAEHVVTLINGILNAVCTIHDRGYFYRRIAPENILISQEPELRVILLDAGSATSKDLKYKRINEVYAAPEVLKREASDESFEAADVYSLGLILYSMLVGSDPLDLTERINRKINLVPSKINHEVTKYFDKFVVATTSFSGKERITTIEKFKRDLETALKFELKERNQAKYRHDSDATPISEKARNSIMEGTGVVTEVRVRPRVGKPNEDYSKYAEKQPLRHKFIIVMGVLLILIVFGYLYYYANYWKPESWYDRDVVVTQFIAYEEDCDSQVHFSTVKEGCENFYIYMDLVDNNQIFDYKIINDSTDAVIQKANGLQDFSRNPHGIEVDCDRLRPGIYRIEFYVDNELVGVRYFKVQHKR